MTHQHQRHTQGARRAVDSVRNVPPAIHRVSSPQEVRQSSLHLDTLFVADTSSTCGRVVLPVVWA